MRQRFERQLDLGQTPIEEVPIPPKSRDELPPVLRGLQWIFQTPEVNEQVFQLLEQKVQGEKRETGRPGMDLWHALVLGVVRLALDCDYDRLEYFGAWSPTSRGNLGKGFIKSGTYLSTWFKGPELVEGLRWSRMKPWYGVNRAIPRRVEFAHPDRI